MSTVAPEPVAYEEALRIRRALISAAENILAHVERRDIRAVRTQAALAADWAKLHGLGDADSGDLGTGSARELAYVISYVNGLAAPELTRANLAGTFAAIGMELRRVLSSHRAA